MINEFYGETENLGRKKEDEFIKGDHFYKKRIDEKFHKLFNQWQS